jgi:hypothetical protein
MLVNNITDYESTRDEQKAFLESAWNRLHVMSKQGHVDRLRMQDVITGLIQGQAILKSDTVPSDVWNRSVKLARSLGVR